jgi:hypothetical protein
VKQALQIIRDQLPTRVMQSWRYYSKPIALDPSLTGQARFAVQIDTGVGSISSKLSSNIIRRVGAGDNMLVTTDVPPGITVGALLDLNKTEQAVLTSLEERTEPDNTKAWYWTIDHGLANAFAVGTSINFVAFPLILVRDLSIGDTTVIAESVDFIVPGDQLFTISMPAMTIISSPYRAVLSAIAIAQVDQNTTRWQIEIDPSVSAASTGDVIYARASVAYKSSRVPLSDLSGPYLVDMMGGKTFGLGSDNLMVSFKFSGGLEYRTTCTRNAVALSLPIRVGDVSLWSIEHGTVRVRSQDHLELLLDKNGGFNIGVEFPMEIPLNIDWIIDRGNGRLALFIDGVSVIDMASATNIRWTGSARTLELRVAGSAFDVWSITTNPVRIGYRSVEYTYVAQTNPEEVWNGTHVVLKPMLKQLAASIASDSSNSSIAISSGGIIL